MASYWQTAKRDAKKRASFSGYCWVWSNPKIDWKNPYLFYESEVNALPPWVPKDATRFGEGPYIAPSEPEPTLTEADLKLIDERFNSLIERQIRSLRRDYP